MSTWTLLGAPMVATLLLVGIHTYLGLHVLRRGVIFVDLALAQVAALGAMIGFVVGLEPGTPSGVLFSLVFAMLGAGLLSILRPTRASAIPQEALIGLVYAFGAALALLVVSGAPDGAEHLKNATVGSLLWMDWPSVAYLAAVFGAVALIHVFARKPILEISEDAPGAAERGRRVAAWDFVFYATFAVVVTHAVATAGVLLVFVFLVAPAVLALMWFRTFTAQLVFGWVMGVVICVSGLLLCARQDLPAGPTIVGLYAAALGVAGFVLWVHPRNGPRWTLRLGASAGSVAAAAMVLYGIWALAPTSATGEAHAHDDDSHHVLHEPDEKTGPKVDASADLSARNSDNASVQRLLSAVRGADLPEEKEAACQKVTTLVTLRGALEASTDPYDRLSLALCIRRVDPRAGADALATIAADPAVPLLVREQAGKATQ